MLIKVKIINTCVIRCWKRKLIKSIDERHKTLLKVATCIVEHQKSFLEIGPEGMKPLVLRDIAEEVELHESTVSRVTTNNKYNSSWFI